MNRDFRDYVQAARITEKANLFLGNGPRTPWTADDWRDLASSVAAETGQPGRCPICAEEVEATSTARVSRHKNKIGQICTASGQWFHIAVELQA